MNFVRSLTTVVGVHCLASNTAFGFSTTTFTDRASFDAATSGQTIVDFEDFGLLDNEYLQIYGTQVRHASPTGLIAVYPSPTGSTFVRSGITFTDGPNPFTPNHNIGVVGKLTSQGNGRSSFTFLNFFGHTDAIMTFDTGYTAFGLDLGTFSDAVTAHYTIRFYNAGGGLLGSELSTHLKPLIFVGYTFDQAVHEVVISFDPTDAWSNLQYDNVTVGDADPCAAVTCTASDACHDVGVCNPATGLCSDPPSPDGTPCADGTVCTDGDTCQVGVCVPGPPLVCDDGNTCTTDTCDPLFGCEFTGPECCEDGLFDGLGALSLPGGVLTSMENKATNIVDDCPPGPPSPPGQFIGLCNQIDNHPAVSAAEAAELLDYLECLCNTSCP